MLNGNGRPAASWGTLIEGGILLCAIVGGFYTVMNGLSDTRSDVKVLQNQMTAVQREVEHLSVKIDVKLDALQSPKR